MKMLILDFETTGVDTKTCLALECATIAYDTVTKERSEVASTLIWTPNYPPISEEISELTGIRQEYVESHPDEYVSPGQFLNEFMPAFKRAEMLCAYNAPFDREVLKELCHKFQMRAPHAPWFDAMTDLPWPLRLQRCRKLQHRALDLGLPMDGRESHRAMADVELICDIFDLYDMEEVLVYHAIPWVYYVANIQKPWLDGGKGRDAAKDAGFGWEMAPGDDRKIKEKWVIRMKAGTPVPEWPFPFEDFL